MRKVNAGTLLDDFFVSSVEVRNRTLDDVVPEELKSIIADACDKGCQCVACDNTGCNK